MAAWGPKKAPAPCRQLRCVRLRATPSLGRRARSTSSEGSSNTPNFTLACVRHDFGYRNYRYLFGETAFVTNEAGKQRMDLIFRQDLKEICDQRGFPKVYTPAERTACHQAATVYFGAVATAR
ncbi:phospholipase A2 [Streptomyces xanthophaeus]|uniref:phospholipase A2 n=1 Tax=Streptomyces xanthophaeus TaxID=67385 RepID=UPI00233E627C|nr:phospholipase A2 [Streptomyces xanthophaeus]